MLGGPPETARGRTNRYIVRTVDPVFDNGDPRQILWRFDMSYPTDISLKQEKERKTATPIGDIEAESDPNIFAAVFNTAENDPAAPDHMSSKMGPSLASFASKPYFNKLMPAISIPIQRGFLPSILGSDTGQALDDAMVRPVA